MSRLPRFAVSVLILAAGPLLAVQPVPAEQEIPLQQWMAPPFWKPDAPAPHADGRGGGRETNVPSSLPTDPMPYVAITPCRLVDTRSTSILTGNWGPPTLPAHSGIDPISSDRSIAVSGTAQCPGIPSGARAIAANVTGIGFTGDGRLTLYPADASARPGIASLNFRTPVAYAPALAQGYAIISLDSTGSFRAFTNTAVDLLVDVNGYYAPVATFSPVSAVVAAYESTSSGTFVDLTTVGPAVTVTVPASGKVLLTLSSFIYASQTPSSMGFSVAGPSPASPDVYQALSATAVGQYNGYFQGSCTHLITGLIPGTYTFTAKYAADGGGGMANFKNREIMVTPLP